MSRALLVLDSDFQRRKAQDWIWAAKPGSRVELKGPQRTLDQNSLMWALLTDVAVHMRKAAGLDYSTEDWKHVFLHGWGREVRFLPALDGKGVVPVPQSSADLSKEEMTDFVEYILKEGAERGVVFHNPSEPSSAPPPADDAGSKATAPSSPAAEPSPSQERGAVEAGSIEAPDGQDALPASTLSDEDRALLVRVFKTMRDCVGPYIEDYRNAFLIFQDDLSRSSELVRAKAEIIRKSLEYCCGENPARGTLQAAKYLAGVIGVDEKEIVS